MLYPLLIFPFTYLYWQHRDFTAGRRFLQILSLLLCAILSVGSIALLFIPASENGPTPISAWVAIPFFLISAGLFTYQWRRSSLALPAIIVLLVLARILFDLVVLPQRARQSNAVREREWALQVDALAGGRPVHLVQGHRAPFTFSFYLARIREKPLEMIDNYQPDSYYLLQDQAPDNWQTLSRYEDNGQTFFFGRFTEPPSPRIFQERAQGAGIFREY